MFEFSIARKYLVPKRKQLSVSLIAVLSVGVISLVVWLLLVFLSVMDGIEKRWLEKLTILHAPLRINPTPAYYGSYYYQVDALSSASDFQYKAIGEKAEASRSDPYQPDEDSELPQNFPRKDLGPSGSLRDPVKGVFGILEELKRKHTGLAFQDYEMSGALLRLELAREDASRGGQLSYSYLTQASFLATFPEKNPFLSKLLIPPTASDLHNRKSAQGAGVFLPKSFQDGGVLQGDRGYLSYTAMSAGAASEQRIHIHVAGFYDPGIMAVGNRCVLAPNNIVRAIHFSHGAYSLDRSIASGIQVWTQDNASVDAIKNELQHRLQQAGIDKYWKVTTFREYDFAKDLLQQFQSDKYLFTLIGVIILIVACCNIISLLVLLVSDKKREIGILQAMGASGRSIAGIFALCGGALGVLGCLIGTGAAILTLHNIDGLVKLLSFLQGHEAFNALFYGKSLPHELSSYALIFVLVATPIISLSAGLVPAIKASRLRPSEILRDNQ